MAALLVFLCSLSSRQLGIFKDSDTLFAYGLGHFNRAASDKEITYLLCARWLGSEAQFDRATTVCRSGLRDFPDSSRLLALRSHIEESRRSAAQAAREQDLPSLLPELAQHQTWIGLQKMQSSEWKEAADHFSEALRVAPFFYLARLKLAEALARQGEPNEALSCYLQAMAASNGHISNGQRAYFLFLLADAASLKGDERLARIALTEGQALLEHPAFNIQANPNEQISNYRF